MMNTVCQSVTSSVLKQYRIVQGTSVTTDLFASIFLYFLCKHVAKYKSEVLAAVAKGINGINKYLLIC